MNTVKIQSKINNEIFEFDTLDKALRGLKGIEAKGNRFDQILLTTPSRRTFKEANTLLEGNGWRIYREIPQKNTESVPVTPRPEAVPVEEFYAVEEVAEAVTVTVKEKAEPKKIIIELKEESRKPENKQEEGWEFMAKQIASFIPKQSLDIDKIKESLANTINEAMSKHSREIVIKTQATGKVQAIGKQHYQFETLLHTVAARVCALLVGPAGSGKTSAGHAVANALELPFYSVSVGMQTTKTEFFGYMDATGKYVKTLFRDAFEKGGVFLIDEIDAGNANVITAINQALANGQCAFPDGMVQKHADFVVIASGNTYGTGANREYVGRNQLDAATLDRFAVIEWNYDEELESSLCPNKEWLRFVRGCRKNAEKHSIRTVISPRASITGATLIAQGLKLDAVKQMLIFKGMNPTEKVKLAEGL